MAVTKPRKPVTPKKSGAMKGGVHKKHRSKHFDNWTSGVRKHKKDRYSGYSVYIHKVFKQVHPDMGMSTKAMLVMSSFVHDLFDRLAGEAGRLMHMGKAQTVSSRDIQTAVRLCLPGELAKHAVSEGTKSVTKYTTAIKKL